MGICEKKFPIQITSKVSSASCTTLTTYEIFVKFQTHLCLIIPQDSQKMITLRGAESDNFTFQQEQ